MINKLLKLLLTIAILLFLTKPVAAKSNPTLLFFWAAGCPHCAKEKLFLTKLKSNYPNLTIRSYEVTTSPKNGELLRKVGETLKADVSGVPFTVIGRRFFSGYLSDETTGKAIEQEVKSAFTDKTNNSQKIQLPIFGEVDAQKMSLPLLTVVLAFLDGFNPCAMWTLLFLISLLLGMKDRRRMWLLGITFIAASALVYFLFLSAWLNLFLFLGFISWIRAIVGLIALSAGAYYLRDYWVNRRGTCSVMGSQKRQRVFAKLQEIAQKKQLLLALGGIVLIAVAVNLVELVCSAGLPAIFTHLLSLSKLPVWQYYLYLIFYIIIFMIDDLFVFFTAMITLKAVGIESKYARYSHLFGGVLILIIGLLLLFKPEWLMFS